MVSDSMKSKLVEYLGSGFSMSGGLQFGGELYGVNGIEARRSPYSYSINGSMAFNYKGFSLPVAVSYRDAQFSYDYTFNRIKLTPTYKWVKLHLGWSSMQFSPYTFAGKSFYGAGIELTPGKFTVAVLKGRLQNPFAIRDSLLVGASLIPIYEREILGAKIGFRSKLHRIELMATRTADDPESFDIPDNYIMYSYQALTPKTNITTGLVFNFKLLKRLELFANLAGSAYTQDNRDVTDPELPENLPPSLAQLYDYNSSSKVSFAGDGGITYTYKGQRLSLKYKRIDPYYSSLSTNFFINDIEQYTVQLGTSLLSSKIRLNLSTGLENNNLNGYRLTTNKRAIVQGDLSINPNKNWMSNINFGNFQSTSNAGILELNDTLRFVSTNQSYSGYTTYRIERASYTLQLGANAFYNTVIDESDAIQLGDVKILSVGISPSLQLKTLELTVGPTASYNSYWYRDIVQERISIGGQASKFFLEKKIRTSLNASFSFNQYNGGSDGVVGYLNSTTTYKVNKHNALTLMASYRDAQSLLRDNFSEWRMVFRYGISF
ncbi:MAG: hypothetical protein KDC49_08515 [Saprospiraceae bacterium]|nr:hypothetical protein [Saprospiraceae bacterium]